jgi:hypothetical protein
LLEEIGKTRSKYEEALGRLKGALNVKDPIRIAAARDEILKFYMAQFGAETREHQEAVGLDASALYRHGFSKPAIFTKANVIVHNIANVFGVVTSTAAGGYVFQKAMEGDPTAAFLSLLYIGYRTYVTFAYFYLSDDGKKERASLKDQPATKKVGSCATVFLPFMR